MDVEESYLAAVQVFADLVSELPEQMWESPGLGSWSLRELVCHTSTSLSGVLTVVDQPAQRMVVASAQAYYAFGRTLEPSVYAAAVVAATASASSHAEALVSTLHRRSAPWLVMWRCGLATWTTSSSSRAPLAGCGSRPG
jgi:hypothetical protein